MILEVAILNVIPGKTEEFELAFSKAKEIISSMKGYISKEKKKCVENPNQYLLTVNWQSLEDHEIGFRKSKEYQEWKALLHHFYDPFPTVKHYESIK